MARFLTDPRNVFCNAQATDAASGLGASEESEARGWHASACAASYVRVTRHTERTEVVACLAATPALTGI